MTFIPTVNENIVSSKIYNLFLAAKLVNTVQLRYIRTTYTRIIRAYFAYTHMSIRVYVYIVYQCAHICPFVMHSHKFLYMKHCCSNKRHMGMKGFKAKFAYC